MSRVHSNTYLYLVIIKPAHTSFPTMIVVARQTDIAATHIFLAKNTWKDDVLASQLHPDGC